VKRFAIAVFALALPLTATAQYYGYDSARESRRMMERQMDAAEQQRMHNESMLLEQQRQMQMDRLMQQQRLDNMQQNSNYNDGLPGLPPLGF
jgi:hypothetical protein